ncbi:hypothetical protein ANCCEY_04527 [Ancylostoma ceylanicum]|uniref:ATP-dependent DNA helicase n=1 Tax=Ancylostoma ceylanicum TaxID=53326 RepID=A0A0D6M212_9BILA|nr:hypothetical protein ANCCEY_04527 [Ancylostoma ceylanicum]
MPMDVILGNNIMVPGGDFRQIVPAVRKGVQADVIAACIKTSPLWSRFNDYLRRNMRVVGPANEWKKYLMKIGDSKVLANDNDEILIPVELQSKESLVNEIIGPLLNRQCSG